MKPPAHPHKSTIITPIALRVADKIYTPDCWKVVIQGVSDNHLDATQDADWLCRSQKHDNA